MSLMDVLALQRCNAASVRRPGFEQAFALFRGCGVYCVQPRECLCGRLLGPARSIGREGWHRPRNDPDKTFVSVSTPVCSPMLKQATI
jgi:hypothetical protein